MLITFKKLVDGGTQSSRRLRQHFALGRRKKVGDKVPGIGRLALKLRLAIPTPAWGTQIISEPLSWLESALRIKVVSDVRSPGDSTASLSFSLWVWERRISVFVPVLGTCWTGRNGLWASPCSHSTKRVQIVGSFSSFSLISKDFFIMRAFALGPSSYLRTTIGVKTHRFSFPSPIHSPALRHSATPPTPPRFLDIPNGFQKTVRLYV